MPKISTYPLAESISLNDYLLGTQVDNNDDTRNFLLSDIQTLFGVGPGGGGAISVTKTALDALVASNGLIPGTYYIISGVDVSLYGGTTILIQAATTNTLELAGHGVFYNPKYLNNKLTPGNGWGIWSNLINCGFSNISGTFIYEELLFADNEATGLYLTQNLIQWVSGDWSAATSFYGADSEASADISGAVNPVYNESDTVIWGGKKWINNTGNVGSATNKYTLSEGDWTPVEFNSIDYNVVADVIHYDYTHDMIIRRKDKWTNDVDSNYAQFISFASPDDYDFGNPIKDFQWGNGPEDYNDIDGNFMGVMSNYVKDSYLGCLNYLGRGVYQNTLISQSYIYNILADKDSYITQNVLEVGRIETNVLCSSSMNYNIVTNSAIEGNRYTVSNIDSNNIFRGYILSNIMYNSSIGDNDISLGSISDNDINDSSITENNIFRSYIQDNIIKSGSIIGFNSLEILSSIEFNELGSGSQIQQNKLTIEGKIQNNTMVGGGFVYNNIISNLSKIELNIFNNGTIGTNKLNNNSFITTNILNLYSTITENNLDINSQIFENELDNFSNINENILNKSDINNNILSDHSGIQANNVFYSGINENNISNYGFIINNIINGGSFIQNNIFFTNSFISNNSLSTSSLIQYNTISGNSYITQNNLNRSEITSNTLETTSFLEVNTLTNASRIQFTSTISNVVISLIEISGAVAEVSLTGATIIYLNITKQIFKNFSGAMKLGYYNASNVFTVVNINA